MRVLPVAVALLSVTLAMAPLASAETDLQRLTKPAEPAKPTDLNRLTQPGETGRKTDLDRLTKPAEPGKAAEPAPLPAPVPPQPPRRLVTPGTRLSLELPASFAPATEFAGFLDRPRNISVTVVELPGAKYDQALATLTPTEAAKQGMVLGAQDKVEKLGKRAVIVRATQQIRTISFDRWILLVDAGTFSAAITLTAEHRTPASLSDQDAVGLLKTLQILDKPEGDPLANLPFTAQPSKRLGEIAVLAGTTLQFSDKSAPITDSTDPIGLIVTAITQTVPPDQYEAFARGAVKALDGLMVKDVLEAKSAKIGDLPAIEIRAVGGYPNSPKARQILATLVFTQTQVFLVLGAAPEDKFADYLPEFREITASFKPR